MVEIKERDKVINSQKFYLCIKVAASRHNAKDQLKIILALTDNSCIDICLITRIFEKLYLPKLVWNVLKFLLLWPVYLIYTQNKTRSATWYSTTWKKMHKYESVQHEKIALWKNAALKRSQHHMSAAWKTVMGECIMKRVQYEKSGTGKRCNIKLVRYGRVQCEQCAVLQEKICKRKKVKEPHKKKGATWKECYPNKGATWNSGTWKNVQHEKSAPWKKFNHRSSGWTHCYMKNIKHENSATWKNGTLRYTRKR